LATQELEDDKKSSPIMDLEKNIAFVEVKHQVSNIKVVQETQHDRLKDIVGILNNHADRLCNMEDSIHELKVDFKNDLNDRKMEKLAESKVSLNSMSERLLEKLLKTHESRPHFVLELFELATELDTDQKRAQVIQSVKNVMVCEKMEQIRKLEQKLENAKNGEIPAIENSKRLDFGNISAMSQSSHPTISSNPETLEIHQNAGTRTPVQTINDIMQEMVNNEMANNEETSQTEQTAESDVIPSDTCEQQILSQEDSLENDMVSQLLRAGNAKIDISSLNEDVNNMVTDLLPILASQYKDKILTDDIIDEAKITICEHIVRECVKMEKNCAERNAENSAEKNKYKSEADDGENVQKEEVVEDYDIFSGTNKVYLLTSLEKCLQSYKGENITQMSVDILSDIGTNIYRSILNAKINQGKK
jgi:AraC-like DNA-binding protein